MVSVSQTGKENIYDNKKHDKTKRQFSSGLGIRSFTQIAHRSFAHHSFAHSLKSLRTNERIAQVAHDKRAETSAIRSGLS